MDREKIEENAEIPEVESFDWEYDEEVLEREGMWDELLEWYREKKLVKKR